MTPRPSAWRYVVPNLVTATSLVIAMIAIEQAMSGEIVAAAWLALVCMITDKLDGLLAKALGGSTSFGVELDSLADLVAFGVAPAAIYYAFFRVRGDWPGWLLGGLCALHVLAVALRLARFNVAAQRGPAPRFYLGLPSTMTAAVLLGLFLFAVKYAPGGPVVDRFSPLPIDTGTLLRWLPLAFLAGAAAMLSSLRVPKLGRTGSRFLDAFELLGIGLGLVGIALRQMPEVLLFVAIIYLIACVVYHVRVVQRSGV